MDNSHQNIYIDLIENGQWWEQSGFNGKVFHKCMFNYKEAIRISIANRAQP